MAGLLVLGALSALLAGAPAASDVQQAYDAAKAETGARHQDDLKIRDAQCSTMASGRWACQIDFVRTAEPQGRLFFTLVTMEKHADRWVLVGGLCRGPA